MSRLILDTTPERHAEAVVIAHAHPPTEVGVKRGVIVACRRGQTNEVVYSVHATEKGDIVVREVNRAPTKEPS